MKYLVSIFLVLTLAQTKGQTPSNLPVGKWEGILTLPNGRLKLLFEIKEDSARKAIAYMASPDQGVNYIPVEEVKWRNDSLTLSAKSIRGVYKAKLSEDKAKLDGIWMQGGGSLPLIANKVVAFTVNKRPQEPKRPFPYVEEEVKYRNEKAEVLLGGTLTYPKGNGPFPAVLLITGSGAQNRDEEIMGHKPFLVLADYLTRLGIAVLRVDDRGVGQSTGDAATATSADNASDVSAGVAFLKTQSIIDKTKIGLVGHSEGGMIAPMVANTNDIDFMVLLAGLGVPGEKLHRKQMEDILRLSNVPQEEMAKALKMYDEVYTVLRSNLKGDSLEHKIKAVVQAHTPAGADVMPVVKVLASPWFGYFINFDPTPYLKKVKCPVLAINGSKDVQVAAKENLSAIEQHIKSNGNKQVMVKELEGLNHLFQTAATGNISEYGAIEETFSPAALKVVGDWIMDVVKTNAVKR